MTTDTTVALTSIRSAIKGRIADELGALLDPVPVHTGWPGRYLERDHAWIERVQGTVDYPLMTADRKFRNDRFTVRVIFQSMRPGDSIAETDDRVEAMYAALEDLLANDPSLNEMPGVIAATLGFVEGPNGGLTDEGAVSLILADIEVHARLS